MVDPAMTICTGFCGVFFSSDLEAILVAVVFAVFSVLMILSLVKYAAYRAQMKFGPHPVTFPWYNYMPTNYLVLILASVLAISLCIAPFSVKLGVVFFFWSAIYAMWHWVRTLEGYELFGYNAQPSQLEYAHLKQDSKNELNDVAKDVLYKHFTKTPDGT